MSKVQGMSEDLRFVVKCIIIGTSHKMVYNQIIRCMARKAFKNIVFYCLEYLNTVFGLIYVIYWKISTLKLLILFIYLFELLCILHELVCAYLHVRTLHLIDKN